MVAGVVVVVDEGVVSGIVVGATYVQNVPRKIVPWWYVMFAVVMVVEIIEVVGAVEIYLDPAVDPKWFFASCPFTDNRHFKRSEGDHFACFEGRHFKYFQSYHFTYFDGPHFK